MFTVDLGDLTRLATQFEAAKVGLVPKGQAALIEAGNDLAKEWRSNATETAGAHGKWYPRSIKARPAGILAVEVGPISGRQSHMSFEFGSRNQPPHLDGQRALDAELPHIQRRIEIIAAGIF